MAPVIRAFHPDARLPESEAEVSGLYRSTLHGKRALLLMDNAAVEAAEAENALGELVRRSLVDGEDGRYRLHDLARDFARSLAQGDERSRAGWNLGLALETLGELEKAAELMQICVDYEREIGHPDAEMDAAQVAAIRSRIAPPD